MGLAVVNEFISVLFYAQFRIFTGVMMMTCRVTSLRNDCFLRSLINGTAFIINIKLIPNGKCYAF